MSPEEGPTPSSEGEGALGPAYKELPPGGSSSEGGSVQGGKRSTSSPGEGPTPSSEGEAALGPAYKEISPGGSSSEGGNVQGGKRSTSSPGETNPKLGRRECPATWKRPGGKALRSPQPTSTLPGTA